MFSIRAGTVEDSAIIAAHRRSMFFGMGYRDEAGLDAMAASFLPWVEQRLATGEYMAWFAIVGDGAVASGRLLRVPEDAGRAVCPLSRYSPSSAAVRRNRDMRR